MGQVDEDCIIFYYIKLFCIEDVIVFWVAIYVKSYYVYQFKQFFYVVVFGSIIQGQFFFQVIVINVYVYSFCDYGELSIDVVIIYDVQFFVMDFLSIGSRFFLFFVVYSVCFVWQVVYQYNDFSDCQFYY